MSKQVVQHGVEVPLDVVLRAFNVTDLWDADDRQIAMICAVMEEMGVPRTRVAQLLGMPYGILNLKRRHIRVADRKTITECANRIATSWIKDATDLFIAELEGTQ